MTAVIRIVQGAEVRDGRAAEPHKCRPIRSPEGEPLTLIEIE